MFMNWFTRGAHSFLLFSLDV